MRCKDIKNDLSGKYAVEKNKLNAYIFVFPKNGSYELQSIFARMFHTYYLLAGLENFLIENASSLNFIPFLCLIIHANQELI